MPKVARSMTMAIGVSASHTGADIKYLVQTPDKVLYKLGINVGANVCYCKSLDGGITWTPLTAVSSVAACTQVAVWYDRWSNIAADLIHVAYTSGTADDTYYRTIDAGNSDALSTETTIFAGATTSNSGNLSITRAVGGNVYCKTCIDAGAEGGFYRLPNANVPSGAWDAARTDIEALATQDQVILLPDLNSADNQDILAIFWDASADEISRVNYDDSANSWAETSIATGMVDQPVHGNARPHFAAAADLTNSQHVLIAWNGVDTLNADLQCWTVDSTTITAKTDVVTNSTDDQGLCAIAIDTDTGDWYAWYGGKTDGSETFLTDINLYMRISTDSGATWSAEKLITTDETTQDIRELYCAPRFTGGRWAIEAAYGNPSAGVWDSVCHAPYAQPRTQVLLGV